MLQAMTTQLRFSPLAVVLFLLGSLASFASGFAQDVNNDPPGAYRAPAPDPSPVETLMLEYINRCRANPGEDGLRCAASDDVPDSVNLEMFKSEMFKGQPAPPLVFHLSLLKASRWHSHYQIHNGQGHSETAGLKGFTGATPSDRLRRAGFSSGASENVFVGPREPWYCHLGFVVDWGEGPGGMQPARGHRRNILSSRVRLAGVGAVPYESGSKFACTHNFANSNQRWLGGVIINDANRNRFYDIGEGVGDVPLASNQGKTKSWLSGAYALPIGNSDALLTVELDGTTYAGYLPDGAENVKFDIRTSDLASYKKSAQLLRMAQNISDTKANRQRRLTALVGLLFATQHSLVEKDLIDDVKSLVSPVKTQLEEEMNQVRKAFTSVTTAEARAVALAAQRTYSRTQARLWFGDAVDCVKVKDGFDRLSALKQSGKPLSQSLVQRTLKSQYQTFLRAKTPEWKKAAYQWGAKTAELAKSP